MFGNCPNGVGTEKHRYETLSTQPNFARGERSTMNPSHEDWPAPPEDEER